MVKSGTNSHNIIGRNPSMVIPLLANQDLTPMLQEIALDVYMHTIPCFSHRTRIDARAVNNDRLQKMASSK